MKPFGYIYKVENLINGKVYIGQTVKSAEKRFAEHITNALHGNKSHFYNAIRKYGAVNFTLELIQKCYSKEEMCAFEIKYIEIFDSYNSGYNLTLGGEGIYGFKFSEKSKRNMSESRTGKNNHNYGKPMSDEQKGKIRRANLGNKLTEETKRKISRANKGNVSWSKGRPMDEKTKEKLRIAAQKQFKDGMSEETRKKISHSNKGKFVSAETRQKISNIHKGKILSDKTKAKISKAKKGNVTWMKGRKHSEETKRKMSIAHKGKKFSKEHRKNMSIAANRWRTKEKGELL